MIGFLSIKPEIIQAFARDESGATAIEYALIATGISVAIIVGFNHMGTSMKTMFNSIATKVVAAIA